MVIKAKKKEVCKKILSEAKESIDKDIEVTNKLIENNRMLLTKKAPYVSQTDSITGWYS